jgi:hypothetical protein
MIVKVLELFVVSFDGNKLLLHVSSEEKKRLPALVKM